MKELIRITPEEARNYIPLEHGDPDFAVKAVAFTLTPTTDPDPRYAGFEDVTYYADVESFDFKVSPLEMMYNIWDEEKRGDERDL